MNGGLTLYGFGAATRNANFGATTETQSHKNPDWWEGSAVPALTGEVDTPDGLGVVFGGLSGSYSMTRGNSDGDASGSTPDHPEHSRLNSAYLGWRSGDLFAETLGTDAFTLSFGRQSFQIGDGFIIGDGYNDTGKYAAYWLGPSYDFESTSVFSTQIGGFHSDLFNLKSHQYAPDAADEDTSLNGVNVDYKFADRFLVGAAYMNLYDSDVVTRDGMDVYNLRLKGTPLTNVPGLSFASQYVHESNTHHQNDIDDDGWFAQLSYQFLPMKWKPELSYRYSRFDAGYDALFPSAAQGWGTWLYGEVVGEYMLFNSNLSIDMLKLSVSPTESLETGLIGYRFRFEDKEQEGVSDDEFAREVDLYADWSVTDRLSLSGVLAAAFPQKGGREYFGGDNTSQLAEVFVSYSF